MNLPCCKVVAAWAERWFGYGGLGASYTKSLFFLQVDTNEDELFECDGVRSKCFLAVHRHKVSLRVRQRELVNGTVMGIKQKKWGERKREGKRYREGENDVWVWR